MWKVTCEDDYLHMDNGNKSVEESILRRNTYIHIVRWVHLHRHTYIVFETFYLEINFHRQLWNLLTLMRCFTSLSKSRFWTK